MPQSVASRLLPADIIPDPAAPPTEAPRTAAFDSQGLASGTWDGYPEPDVQTRLHGLAGIFAVAFAIGALSSLLFTTEASGRWTLTTLSLALSLISAGLFAFLRRRPLTKSVAFYLGLGYIVLGAFAMAVGEVLLRPEPDTSRIGFSGIALWLLVFPVLIPASPMHTLVTGLLAASAAPLLYTASLLTGASALPWPLLLNWFLPNYAAAGLAVALSYQVRRWSHALAEARREIREMGSYRLVRHIGGGGMGDVWTAEHRLLRRPAAIKFVRGPDHGVDPQTLRRFQQEAQSIARLSSPTTVAVYDYGISQDGHWFYAMELLNGTDLHRLVRTEGRLPIDRAVAFLRQTCESLAEAHGQGLLHRDIKPANIMVCRLGLRVDRIKVLDFGLAHCVGGHDHGAELSGTPGFIAPEIILGLNAPDTRSDVYAIGCLAYWLLAGQEVFPERDAHAKLKAHLLEEPVPLDRVRSDVPADVLDIVQACLEKTPAHRLPDAAAVLEQLDAVPARGDWTEADARAWWADYQTPTGDPTTTAASDATTSPLSGSSPSLETSPERARQPAKA